MKVTQRVTRSALSVVGVQNGSAILLTLFACLGVALCVQVLSVVVICGVRALSDEALGRQQLAKRDAGLGVLRSLAADSWAAGPWMSVAPDSGQEVGRLTELEGSSGWALLAEVSNPSESTPPPPRRGLRRDGMVLTSPRPLWSRLQSTLAGKGRPLGS